MPHTASGESPYFLCHGSDPPLQIDNLMPVLRRTNLDESRSQEIMEMLRIAFGLARRNVCLSRKKGVNKKVNEPDRPLQVGDLVTLSQNAATKGQPLWKSGYRIVKFVGARTVQIEHTVSGHKLRVALQHLTRTEPLAIILENSSLDVFPGKTKLYLRAEDLKDLQWPAVDSPVQMGELTYEKLLQAARDRRVDTQHQAGNPPVPQSQEKDVVLKSLEKGATPPPQPESRHKVDLSTRTHRPTRSGRIPKQTRKSEFIYCASLDVSAVCLHSTPSQLPLHVVLP